MSRDELIQELETKFPNKSFRTSEEFDGSENGIWTSGEDGYTHKGMTFFDYYTQDGGSQSYIFGVHKTMHNFLEQRGWYCEWYDAGTVIIYES